MKKENQTREKGEGAATANGHIAPKKGDQKIYKDDGKQHTETW